MATTACMACTSDAPLFDPSKSSSFTNVTSSLDIAYGSGTVSGQVFEDTVTFGGFTIQKQRLRTHPSVVLLTDLYSRLQLAWTARSSKGTRSRVPCQVSWDLGSKTFPRFGRHRSGRHSTARACYPSPYLDFTSNGTLIGSTK